jgi:hypothetical protein
VGDIHALGRGLEVRYDLKDDRHALIKNMPCMDRTPAERKLAEGVAELAVKASIDSATPVTVPPEVLSET